MRLFHRLRASTVRSRIHAAGAAAVLALTLAGCAAGPARDASNTAAGTPAQQGAPDARFAPMMQPEPAGEGAVTPGMPPAVTPAAGKRVVALLLPLTGRSSAIGKAMLDAAQLALFSVGDNAFELVIEDHADTPEQAQAAAQRALQRGAQLILGPLTSTAVRAAAPLARSANVSMVAFSTDASVAGNGVYLMSFLPSTEVNRVVRHAKREGAANFAILAPRDRYGETVAQDFRQAVATAGGQLTAAAFYDPAQTDFNATIRGFAQVDARATAIAQQRATTGQTADEVARRAEERLKGRQGGALAFDALLLADGDRRLRTVAALLPVHNISPKSVIILGTGQWDDPEVLKDPALVGGRFAGPDPTARTAFEKRFEEAYGRKPPRLATLSYDATALAAVLAQAGGERPFTAEHLVNPSGFTGADGLFRLNANGLVERGLAVLEVLPGGALRVVSPAPSSFEEVQGAVPATRTGGSEG